MSDLQFKEYNKEYKEVLKGDTAETDKFIDWLGDLFTETDDGMWKDQCGVFWDWSEVVDENFNSFYNELGE